MAGLVVVAFVYITWIMAGDTVVWRNSAGRKGGSGKVHGREAAAMRLGQAILAGSSRLSPRCGRA
jgi:hypothetical protein